MQAYTAQPWLHDVGSDILTLARTLGRHACRRKLSHWAVNGNTPLLRGAWTVSSLGFAVLSVRKRDFIPPSSLGSWLTSLYIFQAITQHLQPVSSNPIQQLSIWTFFRSWDFLLDLLPRLPRGHPDASDNVSSSNTFCTHPSSVS